MRITLIQPPRPTYGVSAEGHWELAPPFSLLYLAASIRKNTPYEVRVVDLELPKYRNMSLHEIFRDLRSEIFGITATTFTRFEAIAIAEYLRSAHPDSCIVAGGVHFMNCATDSLRKVSSIDVIARGEGELTIVALAKAIDAGTGIDGVMGITYRDQGRIVENPDQGAFQDIDSLPTFDEFNRDEYPESVIGHPGRIRAMSTMSSRGCPYKCIFCSKAGMNYRFRAAQNVVGEIEGLVRRFAIDGVNFLDLTFTANPVHVRSLCREMIDRKLGVKWWCESRVNAPLELLDCMKEAGCVSVAVGVESGSPTILSKISKGITLEQVHRFCEKCKEIGLLVSLYFMVSHPDETVDDVEMTLALMKRLAPHVTQLAIQPTMIFPGTELEEIALTKGILPRDFSWCTPYESALSHELGQLPNIPLFIDKVPIDYLKEVVREWRDKERMNYFAGLGYADLARRAFDAIRHRKPSSRLLLSPGFYYKYVAAKLRR